MALLTLPGPALYAANARFQSPYIPNNFFKYLQAASVALTGSILSSIYEFSFNPKYNPVLYINCQSPSAPALDLTCGRNPLSITAKYFNSIGKPYSESLASNISKYKGERPKTTFIKPFLFSIKYLMIDSAVSLH